MRTVELLCGDSREVLKTLEDESAQCVCTSPPYFGLRRYDEEGSWEGGDVNCDHKPMVALLATRPKGKLSGGTETIDVGTIQRDCKKCGAKRVNKQIGLEQSPESYIRELVSVFHEVKRVLSNDGVLFVVIGDSYAGSCMTGGNNGFNAQGGAGGFETARQFKKQQTKLTGGVKAKDLIGIPWMLAFALRADGWWLRSDIIWHKPNTMPSSVTDRCTTSHEYVFMLSKSATYYFNADAIKEKAIGQPGGACFGKVNLDGPGSRRVSSKDNNRIRGDTRNKRSVWSINTQPNKEKHFATFPIKLVTPMVLAGSEEGNTVLDPFAGISTTGVAAVKLGRKYIGIDLSPTYIEMSRKRIALANDEMGFFGVR